VTSRGCSGVRCGTSDHSSMTIDTQLVSRMAVSRYQQDNIVLEAGVGQWHSLTAGVTMTASPAARIKLSCLHIVPACVQLMKSAQFTGMKPGGPPGGIAGVQRFAPYAVPGQGGGNNMRNPRLQPHPGYGLGGGANGMAGALSPDRPLPHILLLALIVHVVNPPHPSPHLVSSCCCLCGAPIHVLLSMFQHVGLT
jgi:hypothetical protein